MAFVEPTEDDVAWLERTTNNTTLWYDLAPANADGTVNLRLPEDVTFVEEVDKQPALGTAVLIRLTDTFVSYKVATEQGESEIAGLAYEIVPPSQISALEGEQ